VDERSRPNLQRMTLSGHWHARDHLDSEIDAASSAASKSVMRIHRRDAPRTNRGAFLCHDVDTRFLRPVSSTFAQQRSTILWGATPKNGDRHEHLPLTVIHGQRTRTRNQRTRVPFVLCPVYDARHGAKSFASTSRDPFGDGSKLDDAGKSDGSIRGHSTG
jgi:hypothetical protein